MITTSVLDEPVLVLDKSYRAMEITNVAEAFDRLCRECAVVLDNYQLYTLEDWIEYSEMSLMSTDNPNVVRTPQHVILAPEVLLLVDYSSHEQIGKGVRYSRANIFHRDNYTCQYCGRSHLRKELTLDHVIPKCQGGKGTWSNIVSACRPCNQRKAGRTPQEAGMSLLNNPHVPRYRESIRIPKGKEKSWAIYL